MKNERLAEIKEDLKTDRAMLADSDISALIARIESAERCLESIASNPFDASPEELSTFITKHFAQYIDKEA